MNVLLLGLGRGATVLSVSVTGVLFVTLLLLGSILIQYLIAFISQKQSVRLRPERETLFE